MYTCTLQSVAVVSHLIDFVLSFTVNISTRYDTYVKVVQVH